MKLRRGFPTIVPFAGNVVVVMGSQTELKKKQVSFIIPALSIAWCVAAAVLLFIFPGTFDAVNNRFYDWKTGMCQRPEPAPQIVHLDVDDKAIAKYGLWPWDRAMSAKIVERLAEFGAKAVVFDILYTSPGRSPEGNEQFFEAIRRAGTVVSAATMGVTQKDEPLTLVGEEKDEKRYHPRYNALYDHQAWQVHVPSWYHLWKAKTLTSTFVPLEPIILNSAALGHIAATPESDGVHRKVPLFIQLLDRLVPSLCMAALRVHWKLSLDDVRLGRGGTIEIIREGRPIRIPVDAQGMMTINWAGIWDAFPRWSARDLFDDDDDPARASRYKGKIVIVGVTGTGSTDFGVTPLGAQSPLSRIHSNALSTIMMEQFIVSVSAFPYLVIIAGILGILFALTSTRLRLSLGIILSVVVCAGFVALCVLTYMFMRYDVPAFEFLVVFAPAAAISLVGRAGSVELQAYRTSKALERYLSPELLSSIVDSGAELDLSTKRLELTVVFVDIQGFSTISETVEVEYINQFLNDFFERMTQAIFEHQGTVDKFLGDGLLAFFGDPVPLANHALAAVRASLAMQEEMRQLNIKYAASGIAELEKGVRIRIGINTGHIIVGNVGSTRRLEYTVLGSAVNIASRLQSLAPPGGIIMTARTRGLIKDEIDCKGPDFVRVKGIDRDIEVFRIFPRSEGLTQMPTRFQT
ncbi:MAG: adenylate/guanylate cyclase domain-containing protein [Thermodesulfobacteriota bacterium]